MLLGLSALSAPAFAQEQAATQRQGAVQEQTADPSAADSDNAGATIVVTGSRITRRDASSDTPIITVDQSLFQRAGPANVETLLNQLPQFAPSFTSTSNNPSNRGRANVNLRGLGEARTLVLIDGYRFSANPIADVSVIPSVLLSDVEVITGGASAVYGSDAVAGVVNFKMRTDLNGVIAQAENGVTERGDGQAFKGSLAIGGKFADGRGSVLLGGEYFERQTVDAGSRDFATRATATSFTRYGSVTQSGGNLPSQAAINAVFGSYGVAAGTVGTNAILGGNTDGTLFSLPAGLNFRTPDSRAFVQNGQYLANNSAQLALQLPQTRYSFYGHVTYAISNDIEAYAKGMYTDARTTLQLSPAAATSFSLPVTNPFIPADLRTILASRPTPTAPATYNRIASNLGIRLGRNDATFAMAGLGTKGKLPFGNWTFDVFASVTHERTDVGFSGLVSRTALQTLLSAPDGGASLCAGGYNPFGDAGTSAACATYISKPSQSYLTYDMRQLGRPFREA